MTPDLESKNSCWIPEWRKDLRQNYSVLRLLIFSLWVVVSILRARTGYFAKFSSQVPKKLYTESGQFLFMSKFWLRSVLFFGPDLLLISWNIALNNYNPSVLIRRAKNLKFYAADTTDLNDILLRVSAFGLFVYASFSIIAGARYALIKEQNLLVLVTGAITVFQVSWNLFICSRIFAA